MKWRWIYRRCRMTSRGPTSTTITTDAHPPRHRHPDADRHPHRSATRRGSPGRARAAPPGRHARLRAADRGGILERCTRPVTARGGYGLSVAATDRRLQTAERLFRLLPDSQATYDEWRRLVVAHSVSGV